MDYYIVIPAHNEEAFISLTFFDFQTHLPKKVVVVNDNSTDKTADIVLAFAKENPFITLVNKTSSAIHLPGSKVYKPSSKVLKLWTITMTSS
jgi:glycosyltransferase involved in cell wall biosynthesis